VLEKTLSAWVQEIDGESSNRRQTWWGNHHLPKANSLTSDWITLYSYNRDKGQMVARRLRHSRLGGYLSKLELFPLMGTFLHFKTNL
jgi:hypothetical protein